MTTDQVLKLKYHLTEFALFPDSTCIRVHERHYDNPSALEAIPCTIETIFHHLIDSNRPILDAGVFSREIRPFFQLHVHEREDNNLSASEEIACTIENIFHHLIYDNRPILQARAPYNGF